MKRWARKFFCSIIGLVTSAPIFCHAQSPVTIQLLPQASSTVVAADFIGLSFEMQYVLAGKAIIGNVSLRVRSENHEVWYDGEERHEGRGDQDGAF